MRRSPEECEVTWGEAVGGKSCDIVKFGLSDITTTVGTMMPDIAPLEAGEPRQLGPFRIVGRIGEGGQGIVYLG